MRENLIIHVLLLCLCACSFHPCLQELHWGRTEDVADELVPFVGELALGEELGVARYPARGLHPAGLPCICVACRNQRMPVRLLKMQCPNRVALWQ